MSLTLGGSSQMYLNKQKKDDGAYAVLIKVS